MHFHIRMKLQKASYFSNYPKDYNHITFVCMWNIHSSKIILHLITDPEINTLKILNRFSAIRKQQILKILNNKGADA